MPGVQMQGPDGQLYSFPDGTTPEKARAYWKKKGIGPVATGEIGPAPKGFLPWVENLQSDIKTGTTMTLPGKVLHAMGARGTEKGVSKDTASFVGGPAEGPAQVLHGGGEIARGNVMKGTNEIVQGVGQTAAPIIGVVSPEAIPAAVEYGAAGAAVTKAGDFVGLSPDTSEFLGNAVTMFLGGKGAKGVSEKTAVGKLASASGKETVAPLEATIKDLRTTAAKGRPPETVKDLLTLVNTSKDGLNQELNRTMLPMANKEIVPTDVASRIESLITPNMSQTAEGRAQMAHIRGAAAEFQKPWTVAQLNAERMKRYADLGSYNRKDPVPRYQAEKGSLDLAIDKAVNDAIKDTLYPMLDKAAGKPSGYFANLQGRVSNLIDLQQALDKQTAKLHDEAVRTKGAPRLSRGRMRTNISEGGPRLWLANVGSALHAPNVEAQADKSVTAAFRKGDIRSLIMAMPIKVFLSGEMSAPVGPKTQQLQQLRDQQ